MSPSPRRVGREILLGYAAYAGHPLPEAVEPAAQAIDAELLRDIEAWKDERLGFSFEDGRFEFVAPAIVARAATDATQEPA